MATHPIHQPTARRPEVPLALWAVAQTSAQQQRAGRYHRGCTAHPGKMPPALAARVITEYSREGDLVVDPMCGIGTTLVEAARLRRHGVGVEIEPRWLALAEANISQTLRPDEHALRPRLHRGDARDLPVMLGPLAGEVDLVVVSPPYGCEAGIIDKRAWRDGGRLCDVESLNYSADRANLGHARGPAYAEAMRAVYTACAAALRPGGLLVTVTKNTRRAGRCLDLAGLTVALAEAAGLTYLQHVIAIHAAVRDGRLHARPSFWQLTQTRRARAHGQPVHLVVHEDVCLFRAPQIPSDSGITKDSQPATVVGQ